MIFKVIIDADKLPKGEEGKLIADILVDLANEVRGGDHFKPENLINGKWGAAPLETADGKKVGGLELY